MTVQGGMMRCPPAKMEMQATTPLVLKRSGAGLAIDLAMHAQLNQDPCIHLNCSTNAY